jgi:DNA-binding response OmpR family regulator
MQDVVKKEPRLAVSSHCGPALPDSRSFEPEKVVTVLAISPHTDDHAFLQHIFNHTNWALGCVRTWSEARSFLRRHRMPVVIAESQLPDASWKDALAGLSRMAERPRLIVSSRVADEFLWAEVLNLGGYDVLAKPFDPAEVFRVISLAWLDWKNNRIPHHELARAAGA